MKTHPFAIWPPAMLLMCDKIVYFASPFPPRFPCPLLISLLLSIRLSITQFFRKVTHHVSIKRDMSAVHKDTQSLQLQQELMRVSKSVVTEI